MSRLLRAAVPLLLVAAVMVLVPVSPAFACSCVEPGSDEAYRAQADVVFTGTLLERREPGFIDGLRSGWDRATLVFHVDRVHKGTVRSTAMVRSAVSGASCGLELPEGEPVLVFAEGRGEDLTAGLCGGSRTLEAGERPFADGRAPRAGPSAEPGDGPPVVAASAAGVLVALVTAAGAFLVRRRGPRPA